MFYLPPLYQVKNTPEAGCPYFDNIPISLSDKGVDETQPSANESDLYIITKLLSIPKTLHSIKIRMVQWVMV